MTPQEKLEQYSKEITEDLKLNEKIIYYFYTCNFTVITRLCFILCFINACI